MPVAFASVIMLTIACVSLPIVGFAPLVLEFSLEETLVFAASLIVVELAGGLVCFGSLRGRLRPIGQWTRDPASGDAATAWDLALITPRIVAVRFFLLTVIVRHLTVVPMLLDFGDRHGAEVAAFHLLTLFVEIALALCIGVSSRALFRPVVEEATPLVADGAFPSRPDWSLRGRLVVGIWAGCVVSALAAVFAVTRTTDPETALGLGLAVSILGGSYVTVLIYAGMVRPTMYPVWDLIGATRRIRRGDIGPHLPLTSADELGELVSSFNEMQQGLSERQALHAAFGSYVDPGLAQRLIESGSSVFAGEDLLVSVLFADVRDFTSYAERVTPATAVERLNQLFDVVVPVLHEHNGHANHYLGDGLLAIFGAPNPMDGHADAAVAAAIEIQRRVCAEFGDELRLGIGINTGPVIAGTVGGGGRHEFTVIGDTTWPPGSSTSRGTPATPSSSPTPLGPRSPRRARGRRSAERSTSAGSRPR